MTPIALYPSESTLKKSAILGAAYLFGAYQLYSWAPNVSGYVPALSALFGLSMIAQTGWRFLRPSPSFQADEYGFSVMGKKRRGWDEFRGVRLHTARVGLFPVAKWVVVKTGKSALGRGIHIKFTHLSCSAGDMAAEIDAYAKHAQRKASLTEALSAMPAQDIVSTRKSPTTDRPDQPIASNLSHAGQVQAVRSIAKPATTSTQLADTEGPVRSVPGFGERLFGRRKVI